MKGMIKFLAMACFVVALSSCGGSDEPPVGPVNPTGDGIYGAWKLTAWANVSEFKKDVYVQLNTDNTFVLYQNVASVGMEKLEGTFQYDEATKVLTGSYSDNVAWTNPSYTVSGNLTSTMVWTAVDNATDVSTYTRIDKIPDDVVNETRATVASSGIRYL